MLALLVLPVAATVRGAATDDFQVQVWNTDDGLPHSTVMSIAQTPDGYLWLGTLLGGVSRFDGHRFVNFHPGNTPELRSIEIQKLLVDGQGTLWIGTVEGALISYRDGRFRFERQNTGTPGTWHSSVVSSSSNSVTLSANCGWLFRGQEINGTNRWETIQTPDASLTTIPCADSQGMIWYQNQAGQLCQIQGNQFVTITNPPGLGSQQINTLVADTRGRLWVGTDKGLAAWDGKKFVNMMPTNGEPELKVQQIAVCRDGSLWVLMDHELRKWREQQWVARVKNWEDGESKSSTYPQSLTSSLTRRLLADSRGGLWVLHYGDGLWHVDAGGQVSRVLEAQGLPSALVESWFEDREGNMWLGLNNGGLACVRRRTFHTVWLTDEHPLAHSICEDTAGAMWFGTSANSMLRWRGGEFTRFTPPAETDVGFDTVVFPGDAGKLWVGNVQNGVLLLENEKFSRPFPSADIRQVARVIYQDRAGRLWIGSEFGLFCWEQGKLKSFTAADGFTAAYILAITEDAAGTVWIGTALGELWRYRDGKFANYRPQDTPTEVAAFTAAAAADPMKEHNRGALSGGERFWALHADNEGVIWIGTLGGGLLRFQNGSFTRYTSREGLPNEHISQVLEDGRGWLWLGTRVGIVRVNKTALNQFAQGETHSVSFTTYGKVDGLPTAECSGGGQPACWRSRDGRLWFATVKGAVWTDPSEIHLNPVSPPVVVEEVFVDGRRVTEGGQAVERPAVPLPSRLTISPGRHYLDFKFTALSLTSPDKVRFKWRLAGLEPDWSRESDERSVSYSFLPPGDYEFQVKACNNDGAWNETGAVIKLTVRPYFWQTWWFKVMSGGAGLAVILGSVLTAQRRRYRARMQVLERQHALERERTRIARDIHDEVGAKLTKIGKLTEFLDRQSAVAAPHHPTLRAVADTTRNLVRTMDEIVWAVNPRNDTLDNVVNYLVHYTEEFLEHTGVSCDLKVPFEISSAPVSAEVRHNLFKVTQEALNNAIKHGHPKRVRLQVAVVGNQLTLSLEDDGCGFNPATTAVGRNGLENMRQRMKSVGGSLQVTSTPGSGTRIQFDMAIGGA
jgi:signal transduction histidine kinase/ligand-binding sensor domain-containing protein